VATLETARLAGSIGARYVVVYCPSVADCKRLNRKLIMNQQPELNFCPECEAKLEYDPGELTCPNCGWEADEAYLQQYEHSHGY
jgi:Zn finger protein HypA/HybF involved in hydrogenase expression